MPVYCSSDRPLVLASYGSMSNVGIWFAYMLYLLYEETAQRMAHKYYLVLTNKSGQWERVLALKSALQNCPGVTTNQEVFPSALAMAAQTALACWSFVYYMANLIYSCRVWREEAFGNFGNFEAVPWRSRHNKSMKLEKDV
jgi:hypothetical protein